MSADEKLAVTEDKKEGSKNYKGFVAGVFSGVSKLTGMCSFSLRLFYPHLLEVNSIDRKTNTPQKNYKLTSPQLAIPSIQSKSASKLPPRANSLVPSNASSKPSERKAYQASTKAQPPL